MAQRDAKTGDGLVSQRAFEAFDETAVAYKTGQRFPGGPAIATPNFSVVNVRNDSGLDLNRFDILAIDDSVRKPTTNLSVWKSEILLSGVTPTSPAQYWVVLLESLKAEKIGRALVSGVVQVEIQQNDTEDWFAFARPGKNYLQSGKEGAPILWWENVIGQTTQRALVHVGMFVSRSVVGTLNEDLLSGGTATITLIDNAAVDVLAGYPNSTVTVHDRYMEGSKQIPTGEEVHATPHGEIYIVDIAKCSLIEDQ